MHWFSLSGFEFRLDRWLGVFLVLALAGCDSQPAASPTPTTTAAVPPPPPGVPAAPSAVPPPPPSVANEESTGTGPAYDSPPGYQSFDKLKIKMLCPQGFKPSTKFVGFDRENPAAMIHAAEIQVDSPSMIARFKQGDAGQRAMAPLTMEELSIGPHGALLINYEQPDAAGVKWQKWALIFGNEEKTTMIVAAYLPEAAAELSEPIKSTLTGVKLDPTYSQHSTRNTVGPGTGKMKRARLLRDEEVYFATNDTGPRTGISPFFYVSPVGKRDEAHDKQEFASVVAEMDEGTIGARSTSIQPVTIDGVEGFEILADAQDKASGAPVSVYVVVLLPPNGYRKLRGTVAKEREAEFLPEFKAMAHGWKRS